MRIGWIGFHMEGLPALQAVAKAGLGIRAVITLEQKLAGKKSGSSDYHKICKKLKLPLIEVVDINDENSFVILKKMDLDLVFVIGWTQLLSPRILKLAKIGMIGAHASLLPHNRGRAPINWALINGEKKTGNTLFWLTKDADRGDIIDQTLIPITPYDTCTSLYSQVAKSNEEMILRTLAELFTGKIEGKTQRQNAEPPLPERHPEDGSIDWTKDSLSVYNFIRALTRPYPGAFSRLLGHCFFVWQSALLNGNYTFRADPGEVIGPVFSPVDNACGQVVACGNGAIILLELERDDGVIFSGKRLSDQSWKGKNFNNGK